MKFFSVSYDYEKFEDRWHLDTPKDDRNLELDANLFPYVGPYQGPCIRKVAIDKQFPGRELDVSFGAFNLLVLRSNVADLVEAHSGRVQRFPVTLEPTGAEGYEVVFTLACPRGLVDVSRAIEYEFYSEDDTRVTMRYGGLEPRRKGMLSKVYPLHIFEDKAEGLEFFRRWEYPSALIISERLKSRFERVGATGIKYSLVS